MPLDHDGMPSEHQSLHLAVKQNLMLVSNHRRTAQELANS
jgi:hypothetical protein